ncbi:MAG: DUF6544 family protein [Myxococcota bacterium]
MRWALVGLLVVHGLIHLMGFAKAFELAKLEALTLPISKPMGVAWLAAAVLVVITALTLDGRWTWLVGALALVLSQVVILSSWTDAKFGTIANVVLLLVVVQAFAAEGPFGLRAEYRDTLSTEARRPREPGVVTEAELARLPEPVQRYLRVAGVVGQPRVSRFKATWTGRMRGGPDEPWMDFVAEQHNFYGEAPSRLFFMKATMKGLPVDVFHRFLGDAATFRVRVLSLLQVTEAKGPEMNQSETVTLFNDLCLLAPARLLDPSITWEPIDATHARAHFTRGAQRVSAELVFNEQGELIDFVSDDRFMSSSDGRTFTKLRWRTPIGRYQRFGATRLASFGEARWDAPAGSYAYGEFNLQSVEYE